LSSEFAPPLRKKEAEVIKVAPPPVSKEFKQRWSYFVRKVYETREGKKATFYFYSLTSRFRPVT